MPDPDQSATGVKQDTVIETLPETQPASAHSQEMAPVSSGERIDAIDILRGVALFGILTANMRGFNAPAEVYFNVNRIFPDRVDVIAQGVVNALFQGRFISLFAFLFGLGFAVQMTRAEERGRSVSFYPRRLFILLLIGLVHAWLIWWGDILINYALIGFVLFLFRKRSQKVVWITSLALFSVPVVGAIGHYLAYQLNFAVTVSTGKGPPLSSIQHAISVYRDGSWAGMVVERWHDWWNDNGGWSMLGLTAYVLPRFLAGLWVWRSGLLRNPEAFLPSIRKIWMWTGIAGFATDAIWVYLRYFRVIPRETVTLAGDSLQIFREVSVICLACFYACSVFLLLHQGTWRSILKPFGAVGRMALSNYLLQSTFFTAFFRLTHTFGSVGPAVGFFPTVLFFGLQIPLSVWWLHHYQFGPAEWAWRSLTYGKWQPMKKAPAENYGEAG